MSVLSAMQSTYWSTKSVDTGEMNTNQLIRSDLEEKNNTKSTHFIPLGAIESKSDRFEPFQRPKVRFGCPELLNWRGKEKDTNPNPSAAMLWSNTKKIDFMNRPPDSKK